jgi:hypothetical protein
MSANRVAAFTPAEVFKGEMGMMNKEHCLVFRPSRGLVIVETSGPDEMQLTPQQARKMAEDLIAVAEHSERLKDDPTAKPSLSP